MLNSARITATLVACATEARAKLKPLPVKDTRWIKEIMALDINQRVGSEMSDDLYATHILCGNTGIGKTEAAKFLLKKALGDKCRILFVNHAEDFKNQDGLYDAFVWDEANFNSPQGTNRVPWTREQQIAICGRDAHPRTIHARHSNVVIPPDMPRVFTCNYLERCVDTNDEAIMRRVIVHNFDKKKLYV
jgi:hypothetical protein